MSGHEDNLVDQPDNDETSPKVDIPEWHDIIPQQPLEPLVFSNEGFSMSTRSQDLVYASDDSKSVQVSGSVPSLPSLDYVYMKNYPGQSHSWPRSNAECRTRNDAVKHRSSRRTRNDGDNRTICSFPTSYETTPIESTYSSQLTVEEEDSSTDSSSDAAIVANPYMKRIIWAMASAAFLACGAGLCLVLHSLFQSTPDAQPVLEEAQPSDPRIIIDLDLDMGTS